MKIIHRSDALHTPNSRAAALRRLARANRWILAASVVVTGVLTDVAANAFPGHKKAAARGSSAKHRSHASHKPLKAPAQAPKPAPATTQQTPAPSPETPAESAPETVTPESTPESQTESRTEAPVPETRSEAPAPEQTEPAPAPEPSEPVVSGGS